MGSGLSGGAWSVMVYESIYSKSNNGIKNGDLNLIREYVKSGKKMGETSFYDSWKNLHGARAGALGADAWAILKDYWIDKNMKTCITDVFPRKRYNPYDESGQAVILLGATLLCNEDRCKNPVKRTKKKIKKIK